MKSYILPSVPQTMNETEGYENNYSEHSLSYTYEEKKKIIQLLAHGFKS